ncbi:MAG: hypothetical protein AAF581_07355 [Planctomycetota bacterium]
MTDPSHDSRLEQILEEAAAAERARPEPDADAFLERLRPRLAEPAPTSNKQRTWWRIAALIPLVAGLAWAFTWFASEPQSDDVPRDTVAVIEELDLLEELDRLLSVEEAGALDLETVKVLEDWELLEALDGLPDDLLESSG